MHAFHTAHTYSALRLVQRACVHRGGVLDYVPVLEDTLKMPSTRTIYTWYNTYKAYYVLTLRKGDTIREDARSPGAHAHRAYCIQHI